MPESSPTPEDRVAARWDDLERICLSLDTLARMDCSYDGGIPSTAVADACKSLAKYLRARSMLGDSLEWARRAAATPPTVNPFQPLNNAVELQQPASATPPASAAVAPEAAPAPAAPAVPPFKLPVCEEGIAQARESGRLAKLRSDGILVLDKILYYLTLAAERKDVVAQVDDAITSIACLPSVHAAVRVEDLAAGQQTWQQCYDVYRELKDAGVLDAEDESAVLFALGDKPGTVRMVPGDEVPSAGGAGTLPPESDPGPASAADNEP